MVSYKKLDSGFFVFGRQRGVRHFAYTQSTAPASFPGAGGRAGRAALTRRESPGNEVEANPLLVINYHARNSTLYPFKG